MFATFFIWLFARYVPLYHIAFHHQNLVVWVLIGTGGIIAISAIRAFIKLSTTIDPREPGKASELVSIGIYRYSRNPMYLGILLVLSGIALYFGALSSVLVIAAFVGFISKYQIVPEEMALQDKFAESYAQYSQKVRRWL